VNLDNELNDSLWTDRYGKFNQSDGLSNGKIVNIDGIVDKDAYNPSLCKYDDIKILAFRCEKRESQINDLINYHPSIQFAEQDDNLNWKLSNNIAPFDMLEDPIFVKAQINDQNCIVFGGVRAKMNSDGKIDVNTELYKGDSLANLEREPFMIVHGMKDVHLCQLPDGRFLLCRRPIDENGIGHAVLHIVDTLEDLESINENIPPVVIELSSSYYGDWVGINNAYILNDNNIQWIGLLGHVGSSDENGHKHYAAITYKIKLDDLINGLVTGVEPTIIATRACFEDGPQKTPVLRDVIFPGSLEKLDNGQYRLWAGLSDTRIGIIDIDNPFMFDK